MNKQFPSSFMFGAASAAYQVEGAYNEDGKGLSNWDVFSKIEGKTYENTNGDVAVDHYHRYQEDVKLMKEMGLKSYRFSISWSRIIPNSDGKVNQKGLDFYHRLIDELLINDIVPFVTLFHWDLPEWIENKGGWSSLDTSDLFFNYAKVCIDAFGDKVNHFITFNEAIVFTSSGYLEASHPPGLTDPFKYYTACHCVNLAHAKTVLYYKEKYEGEIGITHVLSPVYAADTNVSSHLAKKWVQNNNFYWFYDPILKGSYPSEVLDYAKLNFGFVVNESDMDVLTQAAPLNDFIGVNYYQPMRVLMNETGEKKVLNRENATGGAGNISFDGITRTVKLEHFEYTKWDWEIYPRALYDGMKLIDDMYSGIKIYITENGFGDIDPVDGDTINDVNRIEYIKAHLIETNAAINNGINIAGYYAWSFTDLLSWLNGYKKQYGFVYVDHERDLMRLKKASYYWYKDVINTKGEKLYEED